MENLYNSDEYADSVIGKKVHASTGCFKVDITGAVENYVRFRNEIIYSIVSEMGMHMHLGANSPDLNIEVLD